eukprot:scaffold5120_cov40-Prasinocladus_malaysianus.AAC.2
MAFVRYWREGMGHGTNMGVLVRVEPECVTLLEIRTRSHATIQSTRTRTCSSDKGYGKGSANYG